MKALKGAVLLGQSGGPTSVINASAAGVFLTALDNENITGVYGGVHGIKGILNEDFYDMSKENRYELELLKNTPSSSIGSVRYKLADPKVDDTDYKRLLEVFKKYNIRYFFYNGGNDSMDTANKINEFVNNSGYEMRVMGVPKTIDNDLFGTDHSPGFASAAKYVATTFMELYHDATVYDIPQVTIVEVMGRHAGWLTAASQLAKEKGQGPDLIFLPEVPFDIDLFNRRVKEVLKEKGKVLVAISEGVQTADGKFIPELLGEVKRDSFGHAQLGGAAHVLAEDVEKNLGVKVRAIEFSLMQRSAAHLASRVDVEEAFNAGKLAVEHAVAGETGKMVGFKRLSSKPYKMEYVLLPLSDVANTEQKVPLEWILPNAEGLSSEFVDYALPLIHGDAGVTYEDGLPRFAKLKKVRVPKIK
ncbi:MAG TPA: 6-phosphofructokinase [Acholeplasma sp.]|nr:6-phosphofructokinase [Acholeplasma sp.]